MTKAYQKPSIKAQKAISPDDVRLKIKTKQLIDNLNRKVLEEQAKDYADKNNSLLG